MAISLELEVAVDQSKNPVAVRAWSCWILESMVDERKSSPQTKVYISGKCVESPRWWKMVTSHHPKAEGYAGFVNGLGLDPTKVHVCDNNTRPTTVTVYETPLE